MIRLTKIILVQFYLFDAEELEIRGHTAILGPNGSGKSSLLDAIQIAMMGANGNYLRFNAQTPGRRRSDRNIRDYCLGAIRNGESENAPTDRKRDHATSYITLVFRDDASDRVVSAGVCLSASVEEREHKTNGWYVLPGIELTLADHLDLVDGEQLPLEWRDFQQRFKRKAKELNVSIPPISHSEGYISELLHQLQPQARGINSRDFLRAFRNSVELRDIESVDAFVRQYVVDEQPIDRRSAMKQIEEFRKLRQLVQQVIEQIGQLEALASKFRNCHNQYKRAATLTALAAIYEVEQASAEISAAEEELEEKRTTRTRLKQELARLEEARDVKEREYLAARSHQDPSVGELEAIEHARRQGEQTESFLRGELVRAADRLIKTLRKAAAHKDLEAHGAALTQAVERLENIHTLLTGADLAPAEEALRGAAAMLEQVLPDIEAATQRAYAAREEAERAYKGARAAFDRVQKGGARLADDTAHLIEQLANVGITATPICELVSVKDAAWQPAIEAYLARHRESLVIEPGRERDAVRFVRGLPRMSRPDVTIVQPAHLRNDEWSDPEGVLVGSLLESRNETALAYVRRQLGRTRCVETEEELERYPRALTKDGMLSANGGPRALRLPDPHRLMLGVGASRDEVREAEERVQQTAAALSTAISRFNAINDLQKEILALRETGELLSGRFEALTQARANIAEADAKRSRLDVARAESLRAQIDELAAERARLQKQCEEHQQQVASLDTAIDFLERKLEELRERAKILSDRQAELCQAEDYDAEILAQLRARLDDRPFPSPALRIEQCRRDAASARDRAEELVSDAKPEFIKYLDTYGSDVHEERSDWRAAYRWVVEEAARLRASELEQYREQADLARHKAEEAFRKDIAIRLRENIRRMKLNLKAFDQILATCPPFSNNERYRFEAKPAEPYKALYKFIMNAAEEGQEGLFGSSQDPIQDKIIQLLENRADEKGAHDQNPLDDFRLLFTFDLLIEKDGQVISRLSKRIGTGSNGEHRTPFYVIAGAALAAAYRIVPGKKPEGAALMLLDEAFHGMDHQNAIAVAEFLNSLGLQLVMAAPETDYGKLGTLCDTVYDLARDDLNAFIEPTHLKPAAQALLQSDLYFKHPELLTLKIEELRASGTA